MKIYTQRLEQLPEGSQPQVLALNFDTRQKSRFRAELADGSAIGVDLPRTGILRGGALIATESGEVLQIEAMPERLMQVTASSDFELLKAAYHLGNRHVPLMLSPYALYFEPDHVLEVMVQGLGLAVKLVEHPFEPESGAYAQHHHEQRLAPIKSLHHVP